MGRSITTFTIGNDVLLKLAFTFYIVDNFVDKLRITLVIQIKAKLRTYKVLQGLNIFKVYKNQWFIVLIP
jgi:hypothetical protein